MDKKLQQLLNTKAAQYNTPDFIAVDPISIPHRFTLQQDIEIAGFFASIFAWGNRTIIINKTTELMRLMDNRPHQFIQQHQPKDLKAFLHFKHRTFNTTDLLYFIHFLQTHYAQHPTLETAFSQWMQPGDETVEGALKGFHTYFFSLPDAPARTRKHIATPARGATCKRLCMFLRWMVRRDSCGVDFGFWKNISPAQLVCPVDVHVARVARRLGLLHENVLNWRAALELTNRLKQLDPKDPAKYDFALFGLGVMEKF
mgnify:CR=1 FL=1